MVDVAQLVELRIVVPAVVGSSPIVHPSYDAEAAAGAPAQVEDRSRLRIRAISSIGRAVDS